MQTPGRKQEAGAAVCGRDVCGSSERLLGLKRDDMQGSSSGEARVHPSVGAAAVPGALAGRAEQHLGSSTELLASGSSRGTAEHTSRAVPAVPEALARRSVRPIKPLPPPRPAAQPVLMEFTLLQTRLLPARADREADIRAYRRKQQACPASRPYAHSTFPLCEAAL